MQIHAVHGVGCTDGTCSVRQGEEIYQLAAFAHQVGAAGGGPAAGHLHQATHILKTTLHPSLQFSYSSLRLPLQGTPPLMQFIKNLHLKYFSFSERKKYDDSEDDPANY